MQFRYVKFEAPKYFDELIKKEVRHKKVKLIFWKIFIRLLKIIIPQANPDYEEKIDDVKFWLLEFGDEHSYPIREVGLDEKQQSIVKMPYKTNYGYWTDNELKLDDFKKLFSVESINQDYFIEKWNELS